MKLSLIVAIFPVAIVLGDICPDLSYCPGDSPCCSFFGGYSCCPHSRGVCCPGGLTCCPNGNYCILSVFCKRGYSMVNASDPHSWLRSTSTQQHPPHLQASLKEISDEGIQQCPEGNTSCPSEIRSDPGCCPLPNAVCCSDGKHCCPSSTVCNMDKGTCDGVGFSVKMKEKTKH